MDLKLTGDNGDGVKCANCGYVRRPSDNNPDWQCPQCEMAYNKTQTQSEQVIPTLPPKRAVSQKRLVQNEKLHRLTRTVDIFLIIILIAGLTSFIKKGTLPDSLELNQEIVVPPLQEKIKQKPFYFKYRNNTIVVQPKANYELRGLLVSQNNIDGLVYGYDEDDINIKDICLLWGRNLKNNFYHHVTIWNKQWTCNIEMERQYVHLFDPTALSNTHLIASDPLIRKKIRNLRVGDQVHLSGQLAHYKSPHTGWTWRKSSLVRTDGGNGACEVMYVTDVQIYQHGTPFWYGLYTFSQIALLLLVIIRLVLMIIDIRVSYRSK